MRLVQQDRDGTVVHVLLSGDEEIGYVAVDTTIGGRSCGGLRMLPDVDAAEMACLARSMTLKYGFLGLAQGGAKAGVRGDPEASVSDRHARLAQFGAGIAKLLRSRAYVPHPDMGTCAEDIAFMLHSLGLHPGKRALGDHESGYYTAVSVAAGAKAVLRYLGLNPSECCAAIEGFGKVGRPLARFLVESGIRVVAVSTRMGAIYNPNGLDVSRLMKLSGSLGSALVDGYPEADRISQAELLELPVELLCPCARHHSIHEGNVSLLKCAAVSPGANNPITPAAEQTLSAAGVRCVPDFVSNCGGVLGGTMEFAGMLHGRITEMIQRGMDRAVTGLLTEAPRRGLSLRALAETLSRSRFEAVKHAAENPTTAARLLGAGLTLYRAALIPSSIVGRLAPFYFQRLPFFSAAE